MLRGLRDALAGALIAAVASVSALAVLSAAPTSAATTPTTNVAIVGSGGSCTSFFCFQPSAVSIANNSKVAWLNQSGVTHTITRCTPAACSGHNGGTGTDAGFGHSSLANGGRYPFIFDAPGTYLYYCAIHGYATMHGTVTVH